MHRWIRYLSNPHYFLIYNYYIELIYKPFVQILLEIYEFSYF